MSSRETTVSTGLALAMTDDAANPSAMGIIKEWEPRREPSVWCLFQTSGEKPTARREDRRVFARDGGSSCLRGREDRPGYKPSHIGKTISQE